MKQPRTADFDPHTKTHELKSSMEDLPSIDKPPAVLPVAAAHKQTTPTAARQIVRQPATNKRVKRKVKTRHPFDIYEDQLDALKRLAFDEKMQGEPGSMSAMVRDALDAYLKKKLSV